MKVLTIYGPPAVGKLTVARELAEMTDYKVFQNHLTFDLVTALFEPFSREFFKLYHRIMATTLQFTVEQDLDGVIRTLCYAHPDDEEEIGEFRTIVESAGGETLFVHLTCEIEELKRRVVSENRNEFHKLKSPDRLEETLRKWDCFTEIPHSSSLRIDNTGISAKVVAQKIAEHFWTSRKTPVNSRPHVLELILD